MEPIQRIAVLGAGGTMGLPIARNLARAGFDVRGWNRSPEKVRPLTDDGVTITELPSQAAEGAQAILTIVADGDAVLESVDGDDHALERAPEGALWVQMSTIGIDGTERCAQLAQERGVRLVDAPVLGTRKPAEEGELVVLASGPDDAREPLAPLFDAIGTKTTWTGSAGAGTRLKLVINAWLLSVVEGAAEAIALAQGLGVDPTDFLEAVAGGSIDLPYLQMKGRAMIQRNFEPSFRLSLAAKDARLVMEAAQRHGLELPLEQTIAERLAQGAAEHGDEDVAATYLTSAPNGRVPLGSREQLTPSRRR